MGKYEVEHNITKVKQVKSGRYRDVIQCSVSFCFFFHPICVAILSDLSNSLGFSLKKS